jgi:glycosyltransferase involved in cell wall biosynthesis
MGTEAEKLYPEVLVTVIVLSFNHEKFLAQCLHSILEQKTTFRYSILVHDDASTDGSTQILKELVELYPDTVFAIFQDENQLSKGINPAAILLELSNSKFVAFCEGDDYWTSSDKLQHQVDFMTQNDWCSISHHEVDVVGTGISDSDIQRVRDGLDSSYGRRFARQSGVKLVRGNFIVTCSVVLVRDAVRIDVFRFAGNRMPADWILWLLASERGDIAFIPATKAAYRLHGDSFWEGGSKINREQNEMETRWFLAGVLSEPLSLAMRSDLRSRSSRSLSFARRISRRPRNKLNLILGKIRS